VYVAVLKRKAKWVMVSSREEKPEILFITHTYIVALNMKVVGVRKGGK
jgi:hypothetical protein